MRLPSSLTGVITLMLLLLAAIGGYIANIVWIVASINGDITLLLVLRVVGIFAAPLGIVLGFIPN